MLEIIQKIKDLTTPISDEQMKAHIKEKCGENYLEEMKKTLRAWEQHQV